MPLDNVHPERRIPADGPSPSRPPPRGPGPGGPPSPGHLQGASVMVRGLHYDVAEQDLIDLFESTDGGGAITGATVPAVAMF